MDSNRWKAIIGLSSDHAGINQELGWLKNELMRGLSRIDDARKVRDYLIHLRSESDAWCYRNAVDMRGWQEKYGRKRA